MGAGLALAVVVALRAERERRVEVERDRRFGLDADEPLGEGLQRIALAQLDIALDALSVAACGSPEERVHEARKALKRVRALLRLLQDELGERAYERDRALVRDAGRSLARARDAAVLLSTLDALIERHPKRLGRRAGVRRLRAHLAEERDREAGLALADGGRGRAIEDLLALRARASGWQPPRATELGALEPALARIYSSGRKRMRRAARASGARSRGRAQHAWRKRVKDLRYAAEMLDRAGARERAGAGRKGAARKARSQSAFAAKVARRADDLGELLGEEHDLAVLAGHVRARRRAPGAPGEMGSGSRKALSKAIARRRRRLRARALREGARLYDRAPKSFVRRLRTAAVSRR